MQINRRAFLGCTSLGLGTAALGTLLNPAPASASQDSVIRFTPKAKRVIYLYMSGGPSHLETFDYKPKLAAMDGEPMPVSFTKGQPIAQLQGQELKCLGPQVAFRRYGQSGQMISDFMPHTAQHADDLCIIKSLHTDQINHDPAHTMMNTGTAISGRPSMGAWVLYGIGSESQNLPGFVVMASAFGRNPQPISQRMWHSGFLPSKYQGVQFQSTGDAVHYLSNPPGVTAAQQKDVVNTVSALNRLRQKSVQNAEIATRIAQYELAFRMQMSVPELQDMSGESQHVLDLYGPEATKPGTFAYNCVMARRMAERGVRFIQLYHRGWDHHGDLVRYMKMCCGATDQPTAGLLADLKQRGMLDDTLVIWGGEFGRTPMFQGKGAQAGRDHHMRAFSMWMAGGGIRGGVNYGQTDDLGYHAHHNAVHVNDLHATALHQLGIDHERLIYRYQGRNFRLTDVAGRIMQPWLA